MKYLLDTSVISELISSKPNQKVVAFVDSLDPEDIYISAISVGEIARGIEKLNDIDRKHVMKEWLYEDFLVRFDGQVISLDPHIFIRWGELTARVENIGMEFPVMDAMVAAIVSTHEMVLVTMYEDDFKDKGIQVINPWLK
ncbi:MAG TPA: type II toxin-antitoxin system VapC family toxin [Anaerolineales bacterium]|nr:type II toxin-antitoxin system VapC family toxin [Anaerolineales bacterium]HNO32296.1 type II toxin-antitoxin system VapC family toxin [Anaerolineales bacterium]